MEQLFTLEEVAQRWRISTYQLAEWCRAGGVTGAEKVGRQWRFAPNAALRRSPPSDPLALASAPPSPPSVPTGTASVAAAASSTHATAVTTPSTKGRSRTSRPPAKDAYSAYRVWGA